MHRNKPTPMTDAERQRKHREKRRRELEALRAVVPSTQNEPVLQAQVHRLAAQLDKATRTAATEQARADALQAGQGSLQGDLNALREAVRTLLSKLSPATQQLAHKHLQTCGVSQFLQMPTAEPPRPAAAAPNLSSHVFF